MRSAVTPSSLPIFEGISGCATRQAVAVEFLTRRDARSGVFGAAVGGPSAPVLALASGFFVARPLTVALQHGRLLGSHGTPRTGAEEKNFAPRDDAQSAKSMPD
jgi:hypothetical protein